CCANKVMAAEHDFLGEKSTLEAMVTKSDHKCILLPKFHCELNPIEMYWGAAKRRLRDSTPPVTFAAFQESVSEALASVPVQHIRKWYRLASRLNDNYRKGQVAMFSAEMFKSHRRVPANFYKEVMREWEKRG
ncbi:hypothetical protein BDK51DRAFT_24041, partial [Blyttiomyces helicus]